MWFYVHLLSASAPNGEDLSAQNNLWQAFLMLNWASKSFTSSPDVFVFWTNRNCMCCCLSPKTWASTNREGGNSPLQEPSACLPAGAGFGQDASQVKALTKNHSWTTGTSIHRYDPLVKIPIALKSFNPFKVLNSTTVSLLLEVTVEQSYL